MAFTSVASGVHGLSTQPILNAWNELCCSKRSAVPKHFSCNQFGCQIHSYTQKYRSMPCKAINADDPSSDNSGEESPLDNNETGEFRKRLENIIGEDEDANFSGKDLAMLIRKKYGRSYDVQLIKKEFMGRQLLAMNVMWKYREQRSFPLTEEEYLLSLDDVANNLKCWGAVSYVRNSLAKTKERPRIGKAVSIFIDLDESGGRANEWIYR